MLWQQPQTPIHVPLSADPVASAPTPPKPAVAQVPVVPKALAPKEVSFKAEVPKTLAPPPLNLPPKPPNSASREVRAAYNKEVAELKKAAELAVLQAEVDADVAAFKARGIDWSKRLSQLHVPQDPPLPVSSADAFGAPRHWGGLRDLLLDKPSKLGICPIEKVASSELKKLMLRMMGDPKWRDEPWFKGGIHKVRLERDLTSNGALAFLHTPSFTHLLHSIAPFDVFLFFFVPLD